MAANKLVINNKKTHLLVFCKKSLSESRNMVKVQAGSYTIEASETEKLLGAHISQSLKWQEHTQSNAKSLMKQLHQRINALSLVAKRASFKSRLMLANGLVLSKLSYLIQVWGGTNDATIKCLQVLLNKTARIVTRLSWFTPTRMLMKQCNWLSVEQLVQYHTLVSLFNIIKTRRPKYLFDKLCQEHNYNTRAQIKYGELFTAKSVLASNSFCYRGALLYQRVPVEIRESGSVETFKRKVKEWIRANTMIR